MLFWTIAALLTLGASLSVLVPLTRAPRGAVSSDVAYDLEVYRDQLGEVDRDAQRGLIAPSETEQARAEIARRILKTDAASRPGAANAQGGFARGLSAAAILAVPVLSWGIYSATGSPDLPSQPLGERLAKAPAESSVDELVARAEAHLAANPGDGRGWDVIAPIYVRTGRYGEAANAYRNAIRLDGGTPARLSGLGQAIADAAGGVISADARRAFEQALSIDPRHSKAAFFLAVAAAQEGRLADAVAGWRRMSAGLPETSPWRAAAEKSIAEAQSRLASAPAAPGPDQAAVEAAASMSAADRQAMIETMVAGLDEKLKTNPHDVDGWTRLMRSYVVLGNAAAARDALKRGEAALGAGSDGAKTLAAAAASLGLTATE